MVVRAGIVPDNDLNDRGSYGLPPKPIKAHLQHTGILADAWVARFSLWAG
jgi:hypothetical protein